MMFYLSSSQSTVVLKIFRQGIEIEDVYNDDLDMIIMIIEELFELENTSNDEQSTALVACTNLQIFFRYCLYNQSAYQLMQIVLLTRKYTQSGVIRLSKYLIQKNILLLLSEYSIIYHKPLL